MNDAATPSWGQAAIAAAQESSGDSSTPWYVRVTRWIPIFGRLWDCRPVHLKEAFYEVGCALLFSTLPLWFLPLISSIVFTVDLPFFTETVSSGELLIYAASLSGAMVYFISKKYGTVESRAEKGEGPFLGVSVSFPYGGFFIILSAFICMFSAAIFFMLKAAKHLLTATPNVIDYDSSGSTSWLLFITSVALFFCAVAYRNLLDDGKSYRTETADELLDDWSQPE